MNSELKSRLIAEVGKGGQAYIRNLTHAEASVRNGQFNVAKVLRACAHTQRVLAMESARLLAGDLESVDLLQAIASELEDTSDVDALVEVSDADIAVSAKLQQFAYVRKVLADVVRRSIASLGMNDDVLECDVHQFLWGCHRCGYLAEGNRPDSCPICGALSIEFEWFGPFYATTPEHLGQLMPAEILATLEAIPDDMASVINKVCDDVLRRSPSNDEWCVKEIIGHMIETDLLFSQRVRSVLEAEDIPAIPRSAPPWKLQEGKGYEELSADRLLERLRQARSASLELIRSLSPKQWMRQGTLLGTTTSVLDLGSWLANHDVGHLTQVRRLCQN